MTDEISQLVEQVEKERAEKVARFWALANDPDLATHVAILRNGRPAQEPKPQPAQKSPTFVAPVGFKSGNGIRETIRNLTLPKRFTTDDVTAALEAQRFPFTSDDHKSPVGDALYVLTRGESAIFRKVGGGIGGKPNVYERNEVKN